MKAQIHTLILAAGKGTRMKSELPKVVHPILGRPMVSYVIDAAEAVGSAKTIVITGYKSEVVRKALADYKVDFVEQTEQLGTGHAVQCYAETKPEIPDHLLVICGDTPLISRQTLNEMIELHLKEKPAITMMTLEMAEPGNYGRIIRQKDQVTAIREAKDCDRKELEIKEVNLAVYLFESSFLFDNIFKLNSKNSQNEFYLTDLIEMASNQNLKILACIEKDEASTLGINSRQHLAQVGRILQQKVIEQLMDTGVTIVDPDQTFIGPDVDIGADSTIWPGCVLKGRCEIGANSEIGPNTVISNAKIGKNCKLPGSFIEDSEIEDNSALEPFTSVVSGIRR